MTFDTIIIGVGQAAPPLARELADAGQRVALFERRHVGGSCVNFGCTPTKAAIASARLAHQIRRSSELGIDVPSSSVDFAAVIERASRMALESRASLDKRMSTYPGVALIYEHARLAGRDNNSIRVRAGDVEHTATNVVLDVGTRSLIPAIDGIDAVPFIHAGNWLEQRTLPEHLVVVGGGYIGLEMAQFYRRMGSRVTVVERADNIIDDEDADVIGAVTATLMAEGIDINCGTDITRVVRNETSITLRLSHAGTERSLDASHIFLALGRTPNTDDLGLESLDVRVDKHGYVNVDKRLATNVEGIWAAGDIRGGPQFTHSAWDDYHIIASQLIGDGTRTTDRIVPYALFTDPELGRVGLTERDASAARLDFRVERYDMKHNGRATEDGLNEGFVKVLIDTNDRIIGAAVYSAHASELVHAYITLMSVGAPVSAIRDAIFIHPSMMEALQSVVT